MYFIKLVNSTTKGPVYVNSHNITRIEPATSNGCYIWTTGGDMIWVTETVETVMYRLGAKGD